MLLLKGWISFFYIRLNIIPYLIQHQTLRLFPRCVGYINNAAVMGLQICLQIHDLISFGYTSRIGSLDQPSFSTSTQREFWNNFQRYNWKFLVSTGICQKFLGLKSEFSMRNEEGKTRKEIFNWMDSLYILYLWVLWLFIQIIFSHYSKFCPAKQKVNSEVGMSFSEKQCQIRRTTKAKKQTWLKKNPQ